MKRVIVAVVLVAGAATGLWQYRRLHQPQPSTDSSNDRRPNHEWLDRLYSQNPREAERASQEVAALGERALPAIQATLRDPRSEAERLKAALKASGILGKIATPVIPDVAAVLDEEGLTAEAAIALSHMGPEALPPLRDALSSDDPIVRREALRSIGKLKDRAPLDLAAVLPLLVDRMKDPDQGVRAVSATYLGIIHEGAADAVPALIAGLDDTDAEVRRASAAALGSFAPELAARALPALRKASSDRNEDVAHEAGRAIVKLQQK
jgi:HEAT repeat protein